MEPSNDTILRSTHRCSCGGSSPSETEAYSKTIEWELAPHWCFLWNPVITPGAEKSYLQSQATCLRVDPELSGSGRLLGNLHPGTSPDQARPLAVPLCLARFDLTTQATSSKSAMKSQIDCL